MGERSRSEKERGWLGRELCGKGEIGKCAQVSGFS